MIKKATFFSMLMILVFLPCHLFAQSSHDVVLPDFSSNGLYLNDEIAGDTTATGARRDTAAVYVLERGGIYLVQTSIRNIDWTLRVKAQNGPGEKPAIYSFPNTSTAAYPNPIFYVGADIHLSNLNICGWFTYNGSGDLSKITTALINVELAGASVYVDSCVLGESRSVNIQTSVASHVVKVTNSIMCTSGDLYATNIGNGRQLDMRNVSCDSLIVENCTFSDNTDREIRHYASTGALGVVIIDHCTMVNDMAMHGFLAFGEVGNYVQVTNNVCVDNFVLGDDSTDAVREAEFGDPGEHFPSGANRMTFLSCEVNDSVSDNATWVVRNNYYAVSSNVQAFYDAHADAGLGNLIPLTWHISKKVEQNGGDSVTAFVKDNITLTKPTHDLSAFAAWYWMAPPNGPGKQKANTAFDSTKDYYRPDITWYDTLANFNLAYNTSAKAYTGADNGLPAGDLRWFPGVTGITKGSNSVVPGSFSLNQNYPNPFNPSTLISYSIPKAQLVTLKVYNVLGQHVATLVNEQQSAGSHQINFDASKLSSGVYLYKLESGNFVQTKKMMLLK
jgi:Secretion system C-terminal sorting domain